MLILHIQGGGAGVQIWDIIYVVYLNPSTPLLQIPPPKIIQSVASTQQTYSQPLPNGGWRGVPISDSGQLRSNRNTS